MSRVDDALLRAWPLPEPDHQGDKESRGRVLVVAGSREMPGAAVLAGLAALRAGAGKLVVATPLPAAPAVAAALPEARVIALPESSAGGPLAEGLSLLQAGAGTTAAVVAGPGMLDAQATAPFALGLLEMFPAASFVLDALALDAVGQAGRFGAPVILTPHAGEMAHLTGIAKDEICAQPHDVALGCARRWNAIVALKGAQTCIARPDGRCWTHEASTAGLATSGSGDVLAGIIAGLAARGAPPEQAAVWGVALHARAGERLALSQGTLGYLARELPAQVPAVMEQLAAPPPARSPGT